MVGSFPPFHRRTSDRLPEISVKGRKRRKTAPKCNVRNRSIRLAQQFTYIFDPHGMDIFQWGHMHAVRKFPAEMAFADMAYSRQFLDADRFHIVFPNIMQRIFHNRMLDRLFFA